MKDPPQSDTLAGIVQSWHQGERGDVTYPSLLQPDLWGSEFPSICQIWDTWQCADKPEHSQPGKLSLNDGPTGDIHWRVSEDHSASVS